MKDKPETLIQLLAAYRPARFPRNKVKRQDLERLAGTITDNCAATVAFVERKLRRITEDNEEAFSLHQVREEAVRLKRSCARLRRGPHGEGRRKEVETLRVQYDNFSGSIRHMIGLLDRSLQEKLDEIL